jgi:hypothetical protein
VEIVWAPVSVEEQPTKAGLLPVEWYETTDPVSGRLAVVHLAGDLVLSAPWSSLRGSTDRLRCAEHGRAAATSVDRWVDHGGYAQCCDPAVGVPAPAGSGG